MSELSENIIESLGEGVVSVDLDMKITSFNLWAEKLTGISRDAGLGKGMEEIFSLDPWLIEIIEETLKKGKIFAEFEETLHRKFSTPVQISVTTRQIQNNDGTLIGALWFMRDISGIKSLEQDTLRKDRLAYIGTFATNLAHEVRNPLLGIRGAAQLLSKRISKSADKNLSENKKLTEYTEVIIKEADRLNATVNDMLNFARPRAINKKPINIHQIIDKVLILAQQDKGGQITGQVKREYDPSLPDVIGDENQLTQVFLNLIKNALDAVAGAHGDDSNKKTTPLLTIRTRIITNFRLKKEQSETAKFAEIEIEDRGIGIAKEELEKIFTPFFTTKDHGTGLGLPISYRIIKEHDGFLKFDSTLGRGTTVRIMLPTTI